MDIQLIKTFLEVSATGSFGSAASRLFVTQSAVSLRIQRLEDSLGRTLFTRSKAGADLTPAGREFEGYAMSLLKIWEEARQQVAIPEGFTRFISIGAQYSLWPRLGFRLIDGLRQQMPDLSIRGELGLPPRLTRLLVEGMLDVAIMYEPTIRPGLRAEPVLEEELVLVASWPDARIADLPGRYIMVDWGSEFIQNHALQLPSLVSPGVTFGFGALTADYIARRNHAAYLPARYVARFIEAGTLHPVREAPVFPYPVWSVWREDMDAEVSATLHRVIEQVAKGIDAESEEVLDSFTSAPNPLNKRQTFEFGK